MIARIVHESNWQEDLYLDAGRTRELADVVLDDPIGIVGPQIDMKGVLQAHTERVAHLIREKKNQ